MVYILADYLCWAPSFFKHPSHLHNSVSWGN